MSELYEVINAVTNTAVSKYHQFQHNRKGYFLQSILGGLYIGFGIILIVTIGGLLDASGYAGIRIIQGLVFGVALSMVMIAGADLFTGNNMVMAIGAYAKQTTWKNAITIWSFSYVGNFVGSVVCAWLFFMTGLTADATGQYIIKVASLKINAPFIELLFRGILCNILVCLAVWSSYRLTSEIAKIMMIFICVFPFITSGFEHCVANMTLLALAFMLPHGYAISFASIWSNLIPVTIGNVIGGAVFVGALYFNSVSTKNSSDRDKKDI